MDPPKVDFAVKGPDGSILLTSDNADACIAWANRRCTPSFPLDVVRVEISHKLIYRATPRLDAAS